MQTVLFLGPGTRRKRAAERGMTILEIMIVLAILALVMAFLIGPRLMGMRDQAQEDVARMEVKRYADEAYPLWAGRPQNVGKPCPGALGDLNEYTNKKDVKDPWGGEYVMLCGSNLPPGARGVAVYSNGPDGKQGTPDDIKSWE